MAALAAVLVTDATAYNEMAFGDQFGNGAHLEQVSWSGVAKNAIRKTSKSIGKSGNIGMKKTMNVAPKNAYNLNPNPAAPFNLIN